jgi:hypothetical protein
MQVVTLLSVSIQRIPALYLEIHNASNWLMEAPGDRKCRSTRSSSESMACGR